MKTGIELIAIERQEQIEKHGFDAKHDEIYNDKNAHHTHGDLAYAATHCIWPSANYYPQQWSTNFKMKILTKSYKERLIIAAALLAAEIDRINSLEKVNQIV